MGSRGPLADPDGARARARARQVERAPLIAVGSASVPEDFSDAQAAEWFGLVAAMRSVGREPSDFDAPLLAIAARALAFEQHLEKKVMGATFRKGGINPLFSHLDKARRRSIELLDKLALTSASQARLSGKAISGTAERKGQGRLKLKSRDGGEVYVNDLEAAMCGDLPA